MDITPLLSDCLSKTSSPPLQPHPFTLTSLTSFLQEAYRINTHITDLTRYLRSIRGPYLSLTTHRPAQYGSAPRSPRSPHTRPDAEAPMSDADRKRVETDTKDLISSLARAINELSSAAAADVDAKRLIAQKARQKKGFGALGRWAAGGGLVEKSPGELEEDQRLETVLVHREGVLWCLQRRLERVGEMQRGMVEVRLERAKERNKSVLYKAGVGVGDRRLGIPGSTMGNGSAAKAVEIENEAKREKGDRLEDMLSPEQLQMFQREEEDMVKFYNSELMKIRAVETSLAEISSLQTELAINLEVQSENITQLVADSVFTTENVGAGNKQLKQASERPSTARMVFWATCGLCTTLVIWDLIF